MAKYQLLNEVTFITSTGKLEIRLMDNAYDTVCDAADTLEARYYVAVDHADPAKPWAIFDMRRAQKSKNIICGWTISDPIRTFPRDARDGAVMYALTLLRG